MSQQKNAKTTGGSSPTAKADDAGQKELQEVFDEAAEKGYFGTTPDPTPNENYSLQTPLDAPVPETDAAAARAARELTGGRIGALEHRETAKKSKSKDAK